MARGLLVLGGLTAGLLLAEAAFTMRARVRSPRLDRSALRQERADLLRRVAGRRGPQERIDSHTVLHPFFGYTFNPSDPGVNNFGFETPYDFGIDARGEYAIRGVAADEVVVVGLFGGSFARIVGAAASELERSLGPWPDGRRPLVVSFAVDGHALPQTAFVYLCFADMVEVPVFVDGLNELWNAIDNNRAGVPPEYAKAAHYLFKSSRLELSPDDVAQAARILAAHRRLHLLERLVDPAPLDRSYAAHAVFLLLAHRWTSEILASTAAIEHDVHGRGPALRLDDDAVLRHAARRWLDWHHAVEAIGSQRGQRVLHVLQPNPFAPGARALTPTERSRVLRSYPIRRIVEDGYPLLRRRLLLLADEGALVDDATGVFNGVDGDLWVDAAHPDARGAALMARRVAELVTASRQQGPVPAGEALSAVRTP